MNLADEVAKFRRWAARRLLPAHDTSSDWHGAEWECDYPEWDTMYRAVEEVLCGRAKLTAHELGDLLYVLARDNEDERVMEMIMKRPEVAFDLCDLASGETEARWQLAVAFGKIGGPKAKARLEALVADPEEYVRRRATFALQEIET